MTGVQTCALPIWPQSVREYTLIPQLFISQVAISLHCRVAIIVPVVCGNVSPLLDNSVGTWLMMSRIRRWIPRWGISVEIVPGLLNSSCTLPSLAEMTLSCVSLTGIALYS